MWRRHYCENGVQYAKNYHWVAHWWIRACDKHTSKYETFVMKATLVTNTKNLNTFVYRSQEMESITRYYLELTCLRSYYFNVIGAEYILGMDD
jgi:hypothetical protein